MVFKNNLVLINKILFNKENITRNLEPYMVLIHRSICPMVLKFLTRMEVDVFHHLKSYELTVGEYTFIMEMFAITPSKLEWSNVLLRKLVELSQFTCFWRKKITLFREVDRYYELEEFIAIHKLSEHVISVEETCGVNSLGVRIKIVTFNSKRDKNELYNSYLKFLQSKSFSVLEDNQIFHYYFTNVLPWHRPKMLDIYRIPFENQRIFLVLQTFLACMRELTYTAEPHLDLISLCSLKLACCDDRNVSPASRELEFEIDALIERFLRRMKRNETYIENGDFDIVRYAVDTNSQSNTSYAAVINSIYTFQHIFQRTNLSSEDIDLNIFRDESNIFLQQDFLECRNVHVSWFNTNHQFILRDRSSIRYDVDANHHLMNSRLFAKLLKCPNVQVIRLGTYYLWMNDWYFTDFDAYDSKGVTIKLVGTNRFNFIENFIQFLKTVDSSITSKMKLIIKEVTLMDYRIFRNLKVANLVFRSSKITFNMLAELLECNLEDLNLEFIKCTIKDQTCTWPILINGFDRFNVEVDILEEESTWQHLFESIANLLTRTKLNQFQFKCLLRIRRVNFTDSVWVNAIKFMLGEFNMRLELRGSHDDAIDLYYLKNFHIENETEDDHNNFEFYQ